MIPATASRRLGLLVPALCLGACLSPGVAPAPSDPRVVLADALDHLRSLERYETRFTYEMAMPDGDRHRTEGRSLWIAPAVLYLEYRLSGGPLRRIVCAGTRAGWRCHGVRSGPGRCGWCGAARIRSREPNTWVHHPVRGWVPAEAAGLSTGMAWYQDVDGLLSDLVRFLDASARPCPGGVEWRVTGAAVESLFLEKVMEEWRDWEETTAVIRVSLGEGGRLKSIHWHEGVPDGGSDPARMRFRGSMSVDSRNAGREMRFTNERGGAIPPGDPIGAAVAKALRAPAGEARETLVAIRRRLKSHFTLDGNRELVPIDSAWDLLRGEAISGEAGRLLAEADRLWPIDDEASIRLYNRLLDEYAGSRVVRLHRVRIRKRAEQ